MKLEIKLKREYSQFFFSLKVPFTKKMFRFITDFYPVPETVVQGITSRCEDSRHVLLFDYDKIELEMVEREINYLQDFYQLGNFYLFKNDKKNSFHAVCLEKFSILEAWEVLKQSSADQAFINAIRYFTGREWVLRYSEKGKREKPVYLKTIFGVPNNRTVSTAHKEFLKIYYGVPISDGKKEDGITKIPVTEYKTGSRIQ